MYVRKTKRVEIGREEKRSEIIELALNGSSGVHSKTSSCSSSVITLLSLCPLPTGRVAISYEIIHSRKMTEAINKHFLNLITVFFCSP